MKKSCGLNFDFTGTDPDTTGRSTLALTTTLSSCYVALKHIFPEVPVNGGAFRPTTFTIPEGCHAGGGISDACRRLSRSGRRA